MLASTPPSLSERVGGPRKWTARASSPLAATSYPSGCTEDAALDPHPVNQRQGIPSRLPGACSPCSPIRASGRLLLQGRPSRAPLAGGRLTERLTAGDSPSTDQISSTISTCRSLPRRASREGFVLPAARTGRTSDPTTPTAESRGSLPARVSVDLPVAHFPLDIAPRAASSCVAHHQQGYEGNPDDRGDDDQGIHACGLPPASCPETRFFA